MDSSSSPMNSSDEYSDNQISVDSRIEEIIDSLSILSQIKNELGSDSASSDAYSRPENAVQLRLPLVPLRSRRPSQEYRIHGVMTEIKEEAEETEEDFDQIQMISSDDQENIQPFDWVEFAKSQKRKFLQTINRK